MMIRRIEWRTEGNVIVASFNGWPREEEMGQSVLYVSAMC